MNLQQNITKNDIAGSDVCEPVPIGSRIRVNGKIEKVICMLDDVPVTWKMLRNIVTDTPTPITLPLNHSSMV